MKKGNNFLINLIIKYMKIFRTGVWIRIRSLKIVDLDPVCPERLDQDPVCPEIQSISEQWERRM